jgi:hypothetical protein
LFWGAQDWEALEGMVSKRMLLGMKEEHDNLLEQRQLKVLAPRRTLLAGVVPLGSCKRASATSPVSFRRASPRLAQLAARY